MAHRNIGNNKAVLRMLGKESKEIGKTVVGSLTMIRYEAVMVTGNFFKRVNSTESTNRSFSGDICGFL